MKRLLLFVATGIILSLAVTAHAATLTPGTQINRVWTGTYPGGPTGLQVLGTFSGTNLFATKSFTGTDVYAVRFAGGGLVSCSDAINSKLLYNSATKLFSCATDQTGGGGSNFGTGNVLTLTNGKFVKKGGDTMTGVLSINLSSGFIGLKILQTASGNYLHAEKGLSSSGTLNVNGAAVFRNTMSGGNRLTITLPKSTAPDTGTAPFSDYDIGRFLGNNSGSFLDLLVQNAALFNATSDLIAQNSAASDLAGFIDLGFTSQTYNLLPTGSGAKEIGRNEGYLYVPNSDISIGTELPTAAIKFWIPVTQIISAGVPIPLTAERMRISGTGGNVGIGSTDPRARLTVSGGVLISKAGSTNKVTPAAYLVLDVVGTSSGDVFHAEKTISASGSFVTEGSFSGSSFYGSGLGNCNNSSTSKIIYNPATGKFTCATDQNTGTAYTFGQGLTTNGTNIRLSNNLSGATIYNSTMLAESGSINAEGTISGRTLIVAGTTSLSGALTVKGAAAYKSTLSASGTIFTRGTLSGENLIVSGVSTHSGSAKFKSDISTKSTISASGSIFTKGTLSGELLIISGASSFSGSAIFSSNVWVKGTLSGTTFVGAGIGDCNGSTKKLIYTLSTKLFGCATDQTAGLAGQGLTLSSNVYSISSRFSGATIYVTTQLAASGAINEEGTISGRTLIIAGVSSHSGSARFKSDVALQSTLSASGMILTRGTISGRTLIVAGTASLSGSITAAGTYSGNIIHTQKEVTASGGIISETSVSGSTLKGFGLGSCSDATNSKVLYNNTTNQFTCGTDQGGAGGGISFTTAEGIYVNQKGDTMTGALTINITGGSDTTIGLKVLNTISGSYIRADKLLTSSGSLNVESGSVLGKQAVINAVDTGAQLALNTVTGSITGPLTVKDSAGNIIFRVGADGRVSAGRMTTSSGAFEVGQNQAMGRRSGWDILQHNSATAPTTTNLVALTASGNVVGKNTLGLSRYYIMYSAPNKTQGYGGALNTTGNNDTETGFQSRYSVAMRTATGAANLRFLTGLSNVANNNVGNPLTLTAAAFGTSYVGIGWEDGVNGGKWMCCSGDGGNSSCLDMGLAVTQNTEYLLDVDWTNQKALQCTIISNQTTVRRIKTNNLKTGMTTTMSRFMGITQKTVGDNGRSWYFHAAELDQN